MQDLTILPANEAPQPEDSVLVLARIQQALELLSDDGLIPFDLDGDEIPARYMGPLAAYIAPLVAPSFGKAAMMPALYPLAQAAEKALRRLKAQPYFGSVAPASYY